MEHTRRTILQKASALSALAVGASGTAAAADCSPYPAWDETTLFYAGDRVHHPDGDGVEALWEAAYDSRNAEPSRNSTYWNYVGDCDGSGGGGGNESPTASFTTSISSPAPGEDVTFDASGSSDSDGSISSYDWDFGDGTTGSGETTTHSYDSDGDYTVTLTVTDDAGATGTASTTVSVQSGNSGPNASFTVSPASPAPGDSVTFDGADSSDSDGTISSYDWDFGDGTTGSGQSVTHTYSSSGDYTATLTVTDDDGATDSNATTVTVQSSDGGGGTDCSGYPQWDPDVAYNGGDRVVYESQLWEAEWWTQGNDPQESDSVWTLIGDCSGGGDGGNEAPTASFTTSPSSPAPGESTTFDAAGSSDSDGTVSSYEWDFGDGATATGQSVTHTYDSAGSYTVTLTVTDDAGATGSSTTTLSVGEDPDGPTDEFKVVGYYPGWKSTSPYDYYPEDIPWDKVTDVQYAFLGVDAEQAVPTIMSDQDRQNLERFRELKSGPASDTRVKISIGGWADSEGFSQIAATQSNRQSFADRCVEIVREYDLDGVDIDWEHPGSQQGQCGCGSNEDYETHVDLLQALRDALDAAGQEDGQHYYLSVANGGSDWNAGGLRHGEIGEICDYTMIMSYDFTGSWMDVAGQNAPLYGDAHPTENTQYGEEYHAQYFVEYAVDSLYGGEHDETGYWPGQWEYPPAPPAEYDELVLGLPFYGRGFNGTELYSSYSGLPEGTWHDAQEDGADATGAFDFGDIEENMEGADGWTKDYHDPGATPYIVNEAAETIISYDDPQSIEEKVQFAKERGMQGVMFWELSQDYNETLLDTINRTA